MEQKAEKIESGKVSIKKILTKNLLLKIIIIFLILVLILSFTSAIQVYPSSLNFSVTVGNQVYIPISLYNDFGSNVSISLESDNPDISLVGTNVKVGINQNISALLRVLSSSSYNKVTNLQFKTVYYNESLSCDVNNPPVTILSNFSYAGFEQDTINILKCSRVTWYNKEDSMTLSLIDNDGDFNVQLPPHSQYSYVFTESKNHYIVLQALRQQQVSVTTPPVWLSSLDKNVSINLTSIYPVSSIDINLLDTNFTIEYGQTSGSAISLHNTGTRIYNVSLTGEWITFSENNFNLDTSKGISFTINPQITVTEDTNKTYVKTITIKTDNAGTFYRNISIFIPYRNINFSNNDSGSGEWWLEFIREKQAFCNKFPDSIPVCRSEPRVIYSNDSAFYNITFNASVSNKLLIDTMGNVAEIKTLLDTQTKYINPIFDNINSSLQNISLDSANKTIILKNQSDNISSIRSFSWFLLFIFLFITALCLTIFIFKTVIKKNISHIEGGA